MNENIEKIRESFTLQAKNFESSSMNFSKKEYLDYTVKCMNLNPNDEVLEAAAGTCACGRSIAPFVKSVTCYDATKAMLDVGRREAANSNLNNINFIEGLVEDMPFKKGEFDIVISRLAFHHFSNIESAFKEMARVVKENGKLVIIDMEAASEELREIEDNIETMRDMSHVKNISKDEFLALYKGYGFNVTMAESTPILVSLDAWFELTKTPDDTRKEITDMMMDEINGKSKTGFKPSLKDGEIYFWQRWLLVIGEKTK